MSFCRYGLRMHSPQFNCLHQFLLTCALAVDWRVLVFTFGLSILSGLLLGAAPAWAAAHPLLGSALKGEDALARPGRRWTLRNLLTVAQIAMSVILLSMTGLFLRSLETAASIDLGFRPQDLLSMSVDPRLHGYTPERTVEFLNQLRERVAILPGVVSAACTDFPPLSIAGDVVRFHYWRLSQTPVKRIAGQYRLW